MATFDELVASRKLWIEQTLKPWCQQAAHKDLKAAQQEWGDIAGRVDAEPTLWTWAWSRFPTLVHEGMSGVNETSAVRIHLKTGATHEGYPDARKSKLGQLVLLSTGADGLEELGPFSIDDVESAEPVL